MESNVTQLSSCVTGVLVAQWIWCSPSLWEVIGFIPVGNSDFSLFHVRVMSIGSIFTFHHRAFLKNSPSLFIYLDCRLRSEIFVHIITLYGLV